MNSTHDFRAVMPAVLTAIVLGVLSSAFRGCEERPHAAALDVLRDSALVTAYNSSVNNPPSGTTASRDSLRLHAAIAAFTARGLEGAEYRLINDGTWLCVYPDSLADQWEQTILAHPRGVKIFEDLGIRMLTFFSDSTNYRSFLLSQGRLAFYGTNWDEQSTPNPKATAADRAQLAEAWERRLLTDNRLDCTVKTVGKDGRSIILITSMMTKVLANDVMSDRGLIAQLRSLGFTDIRFRDGYHWYARCKLIPPADRLELEVHPTPRGYTTDIIRSGLMPWDAHIEDEGW